VAMSGATSLVSICVDLLSTWQLPPRLVAAGAAAVPHSGAVVHPSLDSQHTRAPSF
jgi:hypothetical protein